MGRTEEEENDTYDGSSQARRRDSIDDDGDKVVKM